MSAYLCTYRRIKPSTRDLQKTKQAAATDTLLSKFLDCYEDSYYDWGDDPSFFAAHHLLGDVRKATWGVCRRDVRNVLTEGDLVVFFCGSQSEKTWRYYFVGFGTVERRIARAALWSDPACALYRDFYNVLARLDGEHLIQHETFHPFHDNWQCRADAPYILFDPARSVFNLKDPHLVATWTVGNAHPESWMADARTMKIEQLLFKEREISRGLRTSPTGYGHTKLNLLWDGKNDRPGRGVNELSGELSKLV